MFAGDVTTAQGPEHDGAYLEPVTCLRRSVKTQTCSQQPAREAPGRRGGEASKHSADVGNTAQERDAHRRSHSIQQKSRRRSEALAGAALGRRRVLAEFRCMRD